MIDFADRFATDCVRTEPSHQTPCHCKLCLSCAAGIAAGPVCRNGGIENEERDVDGRFVFRCGVGGYANAGRAGCSKGCSQEESFRAGTGAVGLRGAETGRHGRDFPEDKYEYKPTPAQRTFAEQLLHAAGTTYYFTNLANGQKPPAEEDPKRADFKSKAEIVAFVKKCFADGDAAIKTRGDKGMSDWVTDPGSHQQMQVGDLAYGFIEHMGEHYGQMVVYYRLAGLVPPESRPKNR